MARARETFLSGVIRERWDYSTRRYRRFAANGAVEEERPFTADEEALALAEEAEEVREGNDRTIRQRAQSALADNRTFLALGSPTNAQTLAQVRRLTQQNVALIRLALDQLDGTD